ncbi:YceK/YidQ family lipoprotein [Arsenophonus sp.]|uniref:YceK/YidQ family lipoprotein n=1 Tax=unclassified Arsenophonus TaxID=2627083 RepID=UPI0038D3A95F
MKRLILVICSISLNMVGCLILLCGCSSIMTHVGPHQGYYSGTKADTRILKDRDTGWVIKPLAMIDLPFFLRCLTLFYYPMIISRQIILHHNRRQKNAFKIGKTIKLQISLIKPPANKSPE